MEAIEWMGQWVSGLVVLKVLGRFETEELQSVVSLPIVAARLLGESPSR